MKTTEEKNAMIAQFMGHEIDIESINIWLLSESQIAFAFDYLMTPFQREKYMLGGIFFEIENVFELKYHTSWDWLMPVAHKCMQSTDNLHPYAEADVVNKITRGLSSFQIHFAYDEVVSVIEFLQFKTEQ